MASAPLSQKPPLGSAHVACSACRRLKMRCVGAEEPPCARCLRTGRRCVVHPSRRGQQQSPNSLRKRLPPVSSSLSETLDFRDTQTTTTAATVSSARRSPPTHPTLPQASVFLSPPPLIETQSSPVGTSRPDQGTSPGLPSVYSSSPLDVLGSVASQEPSAEIRSQQRLGSRDPFTENSRLVDISEGILVEYIEFFQEKILYCVPVVDDADLRDAHYVVRYKRPLAYCASFVASQFIPGSANIREKLVWHISNFIKTTSGPLAESESVLWTQLQAFAVLYAYRPAADVFHLPSAPQSSDFLDHWVLKYSIEAFALRAGLHRSIDGLRDLLESNSPQISESLPFHKYVYWLWLVTMSHHFSLMTRTPPTIREDSTISSAVDLLRDIRKPSRVTRILAEIDLYMLWQQAGRSAPGLAEWWCTPSDTMNVDGVVAVLEDMEGALEVWSQRWGLRGEPNVTMSNVDISKNGAVDFHFRSTRFCISTFGTRYILAKTRSALDEDPASQPALTHVARESVLRSVKAAHACSRCLIDISPLRRESIRYMAEFGHALIAFCCLYIIQAYETFGTALPVLKSYLASVEEVATFMTEIAVANNTAPRFYGNSILQQLRKAIDTAEGSRVIQSWTGTGTGPDEDIFEDRPSVSSRPSASTLGVDQSHIAPLDNAFAADESGALLQSRASTSRSAPLFSIFDPSWGPLLR